MLKGFVKGEINIIEKNSKGACFLFLVDTVLFWGLCLFIYYLVYIEARKGFNIV